MGWRVILGLIATAFATLALYALAPRQNHFRDFDPAIVGAAEADLWRAYYERRPADLATGLAFNAERSFGLTPYMSARVGYAAARAALGDNATPVALTENAITQLIHLMP